MNKLLAGLVAGLFAVGAFAKAPADQVVVPGASVHAVAAHGPAHKKHKKHAKKHHRKMAHRHA